ncbi:F-box domain [Cedratvirus A11]|uniref:F-box domain n=1 Tax=Cedratvirus A11 TaxID=1903266 RepID=A0A1M7XU97_9VIRU|nr:F-box domain [Cedratvirus A11]SHO33130.1 F-box domain [Cedratvirus A11]
MDSSEENILSILPEEVLEHILSFCGTYNAVNVAVCKDFKRIAPKIHPLVHLNYLLSRDELPTGLDSLQEDFCKVADMVQEAINMQLLYILDTYEIYVPCNLCEVGVRLGLVKVLYWARSNEYRKERYPWYSNVLSSDPDVLEWIRKQETVKINLQPWFSGGFDGDEVNW